jgi:hypothetical protein
MDRDWTFGGQLGEISDFSAGTDSSGGYSCCFLKTDAGTTKIYLASDLEDWSSYVAYDSIATGIDGLPTALDYVENGKLLIGTSTGKVYEVLVAPNAVASGFELRFTDPNGEGVNVVSESSSAGLRVVSSGSKVYTFPSAGGAAVERLDAGAGSAVIDVALSGDQGTMFLIRNPGGGTTLAAASPTWDVSRQNGEISASLRSSQVFNVDFHVKSGRWLAGRASGVMAETNDLSSWVDLSSQPPLWVAMAKGGKVGYSTDGISWLSYSIFTVGADVITGLAFGRDASNNDLWIATSEPSNSNSIVEVFKSSDPTDSQSWSQVSYVGAGNPNGANDVKYGNGIWVIIGDGGIDRSVDGGATFINTSGYAPPGPQAVVGDKSLATDGFGNWLAVSHDGHDHNIFKSTDDAATWTLSHTISIGQETRILRKNVEYANDIWIVLAPGTNGVRCSASGLATDSWTEIAASGLLRQASDLQYGGNNAWIATGDRYGINHTSTDNGATWVQNASMPNIADDPSFIAYSDGMWVSGGDTRIFRSTDNGSTWTQSFIQSGHLWNAVAINRILPNI